MPQPTGSTKSIRRAPRGGTGGSWCRRARTRCSRACACWPTGSPSATSSGPRPASASPTSTAACASEISLPTLGSLFGLGAEPDGHELFYGFSSYTVPPSVYRLDLGTDEQTLWRRVEADVDPDRFEVEQVSVPSRDGTPVTMFLVHRRGLARTGDTPTYLTAYGGFNISMTPAFSRSLLLWLEQGGVVAIPNIRGGGEYGEEWHQGGMLGRKQNSFDDFVAAAEWLIAERIHPARAAGGGRRLQRRAAHGGGAHPAARAVPARWWCRCRCWTCCATTGS